MDISPTANRLAQSRYPDIQFVTASSPSLPFHDGLFDLVVVAELLWYVLPQLSKLFSEIIRVLACNGQCLIIQQFYNPGQQKYGNEVIQTPDDLLRLLPLRLMHHIEIEPVSNRKLVALAGKS